MKAREENKGHLDDLIYWAKLPNNRRIYPDFLQALTGFTKVIGSEEAKLHVYKRIKALILLHLDFTSPEVPTKRCKKETTKTNATRPTGPYNLRQNPKQTKGPKRTEDMIPDPFGQMIITAMFKAATDESDRLGQECDEESEDDGSEYEATAGGSGATVDPFELFFAGGQSFRPINETRSTGRKRPSQINQVKRDENLNLHTIFLGPPGSGKTYMAEKVYNIYAALNLVEKNKFKVVTRSDLVGKYMGWTSSITKKLISQYKNGVIFVDEAYSLVNSSNDSFGKEALTEIMEAMTNKDKNVTIFFAGYKIETLKQLFEANAGLERRIHSIIETVKPTAEELVAIFLQQLSEQAKLTFDCEKNKDQLMRLFTNYHDVLSNNGGDIEVLLGFVKTEMINRVWAEMSKQRKIEDKAKGKAKGKARKRKRKVQPPRDKTVKFMVSVDDVSSGFKSMQAMRDRARSATKLSSMVANSMFS